MVFRNRHYSTGKSIMILVRMEPLRRVQCQMELRRVCAPLPCQMELRRVCAQPLSVSRDRGHKAWDDDVAMAMDQLSQSSKPKLSVRGDVDVAGVYSPPRVAAMAKSMGLQGGFSMDLPVPDEYERRWDFPRPEDRRRAEQFVRSKRPYMLVLSPPCTAFCAWQQRNMSRHPSYREKADRILREATVHVLSTLKLAALQMQEGRYFIFEHPLTAASWRLKDVEEFEKKFTALSRFEETYRVLEAVADQCAFGLQAQGADGVVGPVKKPTKFWTNSPGVKNALGVRCRGCARHVHLEGKGRTSPAAIYPKALCRVMCRGVVAQMQVDAADLFSFDIVDGISDFGGTGVDDDGIGEDYEEIPLMAVEQHGKQDFYDDMSGKALPLQSVRSARSEEIAEVYRMGVRRKVPRGTCWRETGRAPIGTRWVDVDKGSPDCPDIRSRIVAQELNRGAKAPDLFAATPPLEYMQFLVSCCASAQGLEKPTRLMTLDVKKASFYAPSTRRVFVGLPAEAKGASDGDVVGLLERSLHGTRDAGANWVNQYTKVLESLTFTKGASSLAHVNETRGLRLVVHGDDFLVEGELAQLRWLEAQIRKHFTIQSNVLGSEADSVRELKLLNRTISWCDDGLYWEPDARHVQLFWGALDLNDCRLTSVSTPAVREAKKIDPQIIEKIVEHMEPVDVFDDDDGTRQADAEARRAPFPSGGELVSVEARCSGENSWTKCRGCNVLQKTDVEVCSACEEPMLGAVGDDGLEGIAVTMRGHGWAPVECDSVDGRSRWSKPCKSARSMIVSPAGIMTRRATRDVDIDFVMEDLALDRRSVSPKFVGRSLRRPRNIAVAVDLMAVDDDGAPAEVAWEEEEMEPFEAT